MDSAATFDRIAPILVANSLYSIRIVAFDLTGHGKSSHRTDHTTYFISWITEGKVSFQLFFSHLKFTLFFFVVLTIADAMGWNKFCIMAHSMGTGVAIMTAGAVPSRVEKVILLDAIGPSSVKPEEAPRRLEIALQQRLRLLQKKPRTYPTIESLMERMLQSDAQLTEGSARLLVGRTAQRVTPNGFRFSHDPRLRGIPTAVPLTEPEVLEFIKRIHCPVLLIWASYRWYPLNTEKNSLRQTSFQDLRIENVEGNHHVHLEHPEQVDQQILDFLTNPLAPKAKM